jgi:hypothetical protein
MIRNCGKLWGSNLLISFLFFAFAFFFKGQLGFLLFFSSALIAFPFFRHGALSSLKEVIIDYWFLFHHIMFWLNSVELHSTHTDSWENEYYLSTKT